MGQPEFVWIRKKVEPTNWLVLPGVPSIQTETFNRFRNIFGKIKVKRQCLPILLALNKDENPAARHEWSQDYLESIGVAKADILDPFSGQPLIISRQGGRWLIYSVGSNQRDDQGKRNTDDTGLGLTN